VKELKAGKKCKQCRLVGHILNVEGFYLLLYLIALRTLSLLPLK